MLSLLLLASLVLPVGVAAQEPGVLRVPISEEPEHLDPFRSTTTATRRIIVNIFESLVTLDPQR